MDTTEVWTNTFGTSGDSFSWWHEVKFLEGDWDVPGRVRLGIEDPDTGRTLTKEVGVDEILAAALKAANTCVDACTGRKIEVEGELDWDACVSDCVLQLAVLGEVVYG